MATMEFRIATTGQRICAALVDCLVLLPLLFLDRVVSDGTQVWWIGFVYYLVSQQFGWIYSTLLHGWRGQTVGKAFVGIIVVRNSTNEQINIRRAALRDSPYIAIVAVWSCISVYAYIAWCGGWFSDDHARDLDTLNMIVEFVAFGWCLLELVTMLLHPQGRSILDLIADTIVVEKLRTAPSVSFEGIDEAV